MCIRDRLDKEYEDFINNESNHLSVNKEETKMEENFHQNKLLSDANNGKQFNYAFKEAFEDHSRILEGQISDKILQLKNEVTSSRSELSDLRSEIKETIGNHSQILEEKIDKGLQFEITNSRSELPNWKSEIKEVTNSLKSMEASLSDKLDTSDHNKGLSEKRVNVSKWEKTSLRTLLNSRNKPLAHCAMS